jgi:shikimate kinase
MNEQPSQISNLKSQIFIIGFMASGKSTVGRILAAQLQTRFIDLDEEIIKSAGQPIASLIQQEGEPYFRQLETECLRQTAAGDPAVIALGGGAFTQAVNREFIAQAGISVWLNAPFALCWQRIQNDAVVRPLAATEAEARARYQQRIPLYQQAQIQVQVTASASPASLAAAILEQLRCR